MSQQGPILVVSASGRPPFAAALDETKLFPVVNTDWANAARAVDQLRPGAVIAAASHVDRPTLEALARRIAGREPYLPLIAVGAEVPLPDNAIAFTYRDAHPERLL